MKNTRKNILDQAKSLFNQHGYSQVTIRMIAMEVGMSSGNLNYHFKKKEDILEALYFEMVAVFDARVGSLDAQSISFEQIHEDMRTSMERMLAYAFFWTDMYHLIRLNEKIRTHFERVYVDRQNGYRLLFKGLQARGLMNKFKLEGEADWLGERMIAFGNTWLYHSALYSKEISSAFIEKQATALLMMLFPYLTSTGKKAVAPLLQF